MSKLSLSVLGPFAALINERPLTQFRTKSVQALLVYLACQPEAHQREHLMALLWPGLPQKSAQGSLRQTLYLLRKTIPELPMKNGNDTVPLLVADRQTVQMNPDSRFDLDLRTFTEMLKGDESRWLEAVDLYRGDFLADFYLPDSAPFEEWVNARRADLRRRALEALETLADYSVQIGDLAAAEGHARRQLEIDNLREHAHRQLMEILARNGRRAEALSQYEACVVVLENELAVAPSAPTESLYTAIRDELLPAAPPPTSGQEWLAVAARDLGRERDLIEAPPSPQIPNNLPVQATPFVGRETELAVLDEFLANPDVRLITIVGSGGMGKTRLALETARRQLENFQHGVWFSSLAKLSSPDEIIPATAQALHFNFYEGGPPRQQLLDYFRSKSLLLILDNYEHLLDGADLVSDVLQSAPQVKVLVTSREPLRLVEEQLFYLSGLMFTQGNVVEEDEAVQLFLERAHRLRPDLTLKPTDIPHITTICRQVDGMPLGLELAAAWVDTFSLAEIAVELQESLDLLESDLRNIADRHRSLRAVFEASWDRLPDSEQQLFAQMSVFRGGFTRMAAWEICAPQLSQPAFHRLLASLTRKSFLKHDMENGHYDIHELMRQFGAEKLTQTQEKYETVKDRHSRYYCAFLKEQETRIKGPQQKEAVAEIEMEYENAKNAWEWAVEREWFDWLDQALDGLCLFYEWQGLHKELELTCQSASEKLISSASGDGIRILARILAWQGCFLPEEPHRQLLEQSLSLLEKLDLDEYDTRLEQAFAFYRMASTTVESDATLQFLNKSLLLYQELGDEWNEARVFHGLAERGPKTNGFDQVEQWGKKALEIRQRLGDELGIAESLRILAGYAREQGQTEKAKVLNKQSLTQLRRLGNHLQLANGLFNRAIIEAASGKFVESQSFLEECLEITSNLGVRSFSGNTTEHLGWLAIHLGNYSQARVYIESARLDLQGDELIFSFGDSSMIALAEKKYIEAHSQGKQFLDIALKLDYTYVVGEALALMAHAERGQNNLDVARKHIIDALKLAIETNIFEPLLITFTAASLLLVDLGRIMKAVEIYSLARTKPIVANSRWHEDVTGQYIKSAAASLPAKEVAAAEEKGRTLDFWETAAALLEELTE